MDYQERLRLFLILSQSACGLSNKSKHKIERAIRRELAGDWATAERLLSEAADLETAAVAAFETANKHLG
jgi:hypothetical protein